ncbi:MAG: amidohydrolase family protein [Pseudomonadales bacterium]|jgi:imidazolonepropionase-like amidohydrolase
MTGQAVLLEHGRVIDGLGQAPRTASVLFDESGILRVGAVHEADLASRRVTRIDATGKTIMPGLIDAHCHVTFDEPHSNDELFFHRRPGLAAIIAGYNANKVLQAGVTGFLDADCIFDLGVDLRDAIEANVVPGPRMSTGGYVLLTGVGGTAGRLLPDSGTRGYGVVVGSRDEIVREVRRQIKLGVDWVKVHVTGIIPRQKEAGEIQVWSYDDLRLVVDTAHQLGIPVVGHCRNASSARDAARAGFDLLLHATFMDDEALTAVADARVPIVPTLTFQANLADHGDLVNAAPELREIFRREIEHGAVMLRRAYDAGVPLLCGSESGFALTPYGEWHFRELQLFVEEFGMSPLEAIRAATSEAARALKLYGRTGAIVEGYLADILVIDGDPVADIRILGDKRRIEHIFLNGRSVSREPPRPRRPISGWRVSPFAERILTWEMAEARARRST